MFETTIFLVLLHVHERLQNGHKETSHVGFPGFGILADEVVCRDEVMLSRVGFVSIATFLTDLVKFGHARL